MKEPSRFTRRREWRVSVDDETHLIAVEYAMVSGWMSIELDGSRVARGWREWQTVFGGANLGASLGAHQLAARVTQTFGAQDHRFSLSLDGAILPGSDVMPTPRQGGQSTAAGIATIGTIVAAFTLAPRSIANAIVSVAIGLLIIGAIRLGTFSGRQRAALVVILLVLWIPALFLVSMTTRRA